MEGHRFYKYATFDSYQEVERLLVDSGFTIIVAGRTPSSGDKEVS